MAGWDILQQPFQYHQPVAPEVPTPDNTAAKIISAGTETALSNFTRMAVARRQADLEQQQQIQQAALTMRAQDIAAENNKMDYEVGMANAESLRQYRMGGSGVSDPRVRAQIAFDRRELDRQREEEYNAGVAATDIRGIKELMDSGLNNEEKWNTDPVGQLEKYQNWMGRWGNAVAGQLPIEAKKLTNRAELLKIPVRFGATYKEGGMYVPEGSPIGTKPRFRMGEYSGGNPENVPMLQFLEKWRYHPELRDQLRQAAMAGGNTHIVDRLDKNMGPSGTIIHSRVLNPDIEGIFGKAGSANFERPASQVPAEYQRPFKKAYPNEPVYDQSGELPPAGPTFPTPTSPIPETTPIEPAPISFNTTDADRTLQQARRALAANPGARDEIMRRLAGMQINPNLLVA